MTVVSTISHTDGTRIHSSVIGEKVKMMMNQRKMKRNAGKSRPMQPVSWEYWNSLKDAASYLDQELTKLDGGDRYDVMSTLLEARLMVLNVNPLGRDDR